jgi:sugar transferase (PEP-CTERM/EpsH1 system associated)
MTGQAPRVVHVIYRLAVGGLENGVVNLVNRLPADAWRHTIVALTDVDHDFAGRIRGENVELVSLGKGPGHALGVYLRLWQLLRRLQPSIVHTRNLAALEMTPVAWAAGVPVRVHGEHGRDAIDPDGANLRRQRVRRLYRPFVTHYVALSPDLETYLSRSIGVPAHRIDQIYNGVDTSRFAPQAARARIEGSPFCDAAHRLVGAVGRLDPVKDHANLARAFVAVLKREPALRETLRLVIVGDGPERARVESILHDAGVRGLVWLAGERHDIPAILQGLDVFVLPSFGEGVSNTILEAMAAGLPVIATRVGANADLVADGVTGRIVPRSDSEALAGAIAAYAADPSLGHVHGRAGRLRVEQRFSLDRMVERYHALYLSLVNRVAAAGCDADGATGSHASH